MTFPPPIPSVSAEERRDLRYAKTLLENPGFAVRIANLLGAPVEKGFALLPKGASEAIGKASRSALLNALELAIRTMDKRSTRKSSEFLHKILVGATGGVGGAFGLAGMLIELPVSTSIMLRSIADIARSEGRNLVLVNTKLDCLEVFAFGGRSKSDDAAESSYWLARAALSKAISDAAAYFAQRGLVEKSAPAVVRLISAIAARFGPIVTEQVAAKAIPVVGAASGTLVNILFMDHFQDMARGHFIVRRLEDKHGSAAVKHFYGQM